MTPAEKLQELRRELARNEREPASYSSMLVTRHLMREIRALEAEIEHAAVPRARGAA